MVGRVSASAIGMASVGNFKNQDSIFDPGFRSRLDIIQCIKKAGENSATRYACV